MGLKCAVAEFLIGTANPSTYNLYVNELKMENIDVCFLCVQTVQTL